MLQCPFFLLFPQSAQSGTGVTFGPVKQAWKMVKSSLVQPDFME